MKLESKQYDARSVELFKCDQCHGLHLRSVIDSVASVVSVMDPDQWADLFMADEEFRREVASRLKPGGAA